MSSKYYRGLISSINDVKYKLQLASMTLKLSGVFGLPYRLASLLIYIYM